MDLKASIRLVKLKGASINKVVYLDIPKKGNAPMLLLEILAEQGFKMNQVKIEREDYFTIHLNLDDSTIKMIRNYINNNL